MSKTNHFDSFFHQSYFDCRLAFLSSVSLLKQKYNFVDHQSLKVPGKTDDDLFIDTVHLKTKEDNKNLIILTSGLHGVELFAGNALQLLLMDKLLNDASFKNFDFLIIHAVNPWGAKNKRRVNETNVDLNRNFGLSEELFSTINKPYESLNHHLNPKKKLSTNFWAYFSFISKMLFKALIKSKRFISEAVGVGQYQFEKGVVFGGFEFQKEKEILQPVFKATIANYKTIITVDLHTGMGKKGDLHILNAPGSNKATKQYTDILFNGTNDDDEIFYKEHGSFLDYISSLCSNNQHSLPVMFEFGTIDTQTLIGSAKLLINTSFENQGYQYGFKTKKDEIIKNNYQEIFFSASEKWRTDIASKFLEKFLLIPQNINKINN